MGSLCNGSSEKPEFPDVDVIEVSSSEGMFQSSPRIELTSSLRHLAPHKEVRSNSTSEELDCVKPSLQDGLNLFSLTNISRQVTDRNMKADFLKVTDSDLQFSSQNTFFKKLDDDMSLFEKKPPPQMSSHEKINSYNIKKRSYDSPAGPVYIDGDRAIHCADGTVFLEDGTLVGPTLEGNENIYFKRYTAEDQMGDLRTIFAEKLKEVQSSMGEQVPSLNDIMSTGKSQRPW